MATQSPDATSNPATTNNFPQDPSDFDSDPRVSFSKLDNKFILETDDGNEFEYNTVLKRWIPTVCARFFSSWMPLVVLSGGD